jgi:prepilin-type N-terminal cleavage/methylation domain-containing protein
VSRQLSGEMGFTLVEILVAIAIFGILVTLSYSGMEYVRKHRLQSASRELLSDLQRIRQDAITRSTQNKSGGTVNGGWFGIRFDSNASYQLF